MEHNFPRTANANGEIISDVNLKKRNTISLVELNDNIYHTTVHTYEFGEAIVIRAIVRR